jgi:hypothetical protein
MSTAPQRTFYQVLGVAPHATHEELRTAHRQLARVLHPDRLAGSSPAERALAERRMREVNEAWTTLSEPGRRAEYDRRLAGGSHAGRGNRPGSAARPSNGGTNAGTTGHRSGRPEDDDDPDAAFARARAAQIDPDEPDLSAAQYLLLRRGPVVLVVLVGLLLFVVTAYAGGAGTDASAPTTVPADLPVCVRLFDGRNSVPVSCDLPNDGRLVTFVQAPLDCPAKTSYVILDSRIGCATKDPAVLADQPPTTRG